MRNKDILLDDEVVFRVVMAGSLKFTCSWSTNRLLRVARNYSAISVCVCYLWVIRCSESACFWFPPGWATRKNRQRCFVELLIGAQLIENKTITVFDDECHCFVSGFFETKV